MIPPPPKACPEEADPEVELESPLEFESPDWPAVEPGSDVVPALPDPEDELLLESKIEPPPDG